MSQEPKPEQWQPYLASDIWGKCIQTGMKIFNMRIRSILMYGLKSISRKLSVTNLHELDRVKSLYLKKLLLLLPKSTSVTLVHELCREQQFCQDMINREVILPQEEVRRKYLKEIEEKDFDFVLKRFTDGPAFTHNTWRLTLSSRHTICGFTAHGFHHLWCNKNGYYDPCGDCVCKFCSLSTGSKEKGLDVDKLHALSCPNIAGVTLAEKHLFLSSFNLTAAL